MSTRALSTLPIIRSRRDLFRPGFYPPGYEEVISNTESVAQSTLSATLSGASISPEGGEGTDSLFKKPENVGRKTSGTALKSARTPREKEAGGL